jgi:hypothetical protein
MKKALAIIIFILVSVIAIQEYRIRRIDSTPVTVTVIHDTITITTPAPVSVAETGQIRAKLPLATKRVSEKTPEMDGKHELPLIDNLPAGVDSPEVIIPISTKVYEDSLYRAVVSGYNVSLDSIQIYRHTVYVDHFREVTKKVKPHRWSFGVQVGYGTDFKGLHPYFGIGIGYRLFEF